MEAISLFVNGIPELSKRIEELIGCGDIPTERIALNAGDYLFREGDANHNTFYIDRGLIRLFSESAEGYSKTVFFYKAGSFIGFQALQGQDTRYRSILSAKATTRCNIHAIDSKVFEKILRSDGNLCFEVTRFMFEQLALATRESVNASIYSVLQRFSALLLALSSELGVPQSPAIIPFSNEELANMLGVHPNSIANSIIALRNAGCIEKKRSTLTITDFRKLKSVAENLIIDRK